MRVIKDYTICSGGSMDVVDRVRKLIAEGWEPLGAPTAVNFEGFKDVTQTMVWVEEE